MDALMPAELCLCMVERREKGAPVLISMPLTDFLSCKPPTRYYIHAYGSVYGIAGHVVAGVIAKNAGNLRLLANEGDHACI